MRRHRALIGAAIAAALILLVVLAFDGIPEPFAGFAAPFAFAVWAAERGKKRDAVIYTRRAELQEYLKAEELKHRRRGQGDAAG